jgi:Fe-S-cluster containining protein
MKVFGDIFRRYQELVAGADNSFSAFKNEYDQQIKCEIQCSDCCSSVFGLFLVESAYLNIEFARLDRKKRREALLRGEKAHREWLQLEKRLPENGGEDTLALARERVRCPLLDKGGKCLLYWARPLTCRVYGMPTLIDGKVRTCWKAGFGEGGGYPAYDLDGAYRELHALSKMMLARVGQKELDRASLLVSVARSISTPVENLLKPI